MLANQAMNYLVSGRSPTRLGNAHPNIAPYQVFAVADGHVIVAVGNDRQFQSLCRAIGAEAAGAEPDFATNPLRVANRARLAAALTPRLSGFTRAALLAKLEAAGVPAGPINRIEDVFADPQVIHRGMRLELVGDDGAKVAGVASPIVIDGVRMASDRPSPRLGEAAE
jgi:crotonobetainyl-CoA:carnitine CoA-transferase CaiB-like acyl-CoA transferase